MKGLFKLWQRKKFPFKFIYSQDYWLVDLGNHVFPVEKYRIIYERLLHWGAKKKSVVSPQPAKEEDLLLVHTPKYLRKLRTGNLSPSEILAMELPYSPDLMKFALLHVGGTILASRIALAEGLCVHIGGGFHHAFPDHGEGFCVVHDVAVAVEKMKKEGKMERAMVVDCDVHQGNGTAFIFSGKDYVYTFSLHQMDLYPAQKEPSSLDLGLWSGDGDDKYLSMLSSHIPRIYKEFKPDLIYYLAGSDPYKNDQLGGLNVSLDGLKKRDRMIIEGARELQIPVVILLAGGYAFDVRDSAAAHLNTIKIAQKIQRKYS
ncbi:MAG: histone deacetylase [Candidatus Aminicenantes bacterium]